ncbi:MAG TPA: ATP-binding cassette domain-containing protein, partial [Nocardioidaceae bacterium]|nr:ATP-binding cassette domain-containing protein [Nocardioidaceae bacterium]
MTKDRPPETKNLCIVAGVDAPELTALQERARLRAAARAGGADRLRGHIVCDGLVRIFKAEGVEVVALQGLDLVVDRGDLMALVGASGSGKSTLLTILSGLDVPTAGTPTTNRPSHRLRCIRSRHNPVSTSRGEAQCRARRHACRRAESDMSDVIDVGASGRP